MGDSFDAWILRNGIAPTTAQAVPFEQSKGPKSRVLLARMIANLKLDVVRTAHVGRPSEHVQELRDEGPMTPQAPKPATTTGADGSNMGARLREERVRLGYPQPAFGQLGGVKRLAHIHYEVGRRSPDATYLVGIAGSGADILYIVNGRRTPG